MRRRKLGRTGLEVSEIAFGGVEIGMPYGIGVKSQDDMLTEKEAIGLLHAAVDEGINFFDTARSYGHSEHIMGKAFNRIRDEVIISTKCVHLPGESKKLPGAGMLKNIIEGSLHESLKALRTNHLDIFMVHSATSDILMNEDIVQVFSDLKKAGKTRAIGASTYLPEETNCALAKGVWDVIQLPFNLLDQRQKEFFDLAEKKGVGIVVRSVLLKGLLSDRGKNLHPALKEVEDHIQYYTELLNDQVPDLPTLATKFALSFNEVSSVLVGMDSIEYLNQSVQTADGNYMNKKELTRAAKLSYPNPAFLDLPYWDKMGWLK